MTTIRAETKWDLKCVGVELFICFSSQALMIFYLQQGQKWEQRDHTNHNFWYIRSKLFFNPIWMCEILFENLQKPKRKLLDWTQSCSLFLNKCNSRFNESTDLKFDKVYIEMINNYGAY